MKKTFCLLLTLVLLLACSNGVSRRQLPTENDNRHVLFETYEKTIARRPKASTSQSASSSATKRSTTRTSSSTHDNMRGFDPASEDDTDDNGMSRYMENTDDEGWD